MAVISDSTLIACTLEEAFDYFSDICNEPEWNMAAVSMEKRTAARHGKNGSIGLLRPVNVPRWVTTTSSNCPY